MKAAFAPHKISKQQFEPIKNDVVVEAMTFDERITQSGLVLLNDNGTSLGIRPRWAQVYAIGPDQSTVTVGQWVLIAHGRWTRGIEIEDDEGTKILRKVDPNDIMLVSDEPIFDETQSTAVHVARQFN